MGWIEDIRQRIKQLNKSVDEYKKETNNQQIPSLAYVNRAKKMIEKGQFPEAKEILDQALVISDKDAIVYKYLGVCEEKIGHIEAAINLYKKSALLDEQDKKIWYKLGMAQVMLKQYQDAEKSFEAAHKITPVNTDVETGWGMTLLKQKKYKEAYEKFVNAIKINRYNYAALLLCAISEIRLGKYDDAYKKLSFLIKANPTESCMYEFANLNYIKENYDDAVKYAKYAVEYNQSMLPAYILLGKIYAMKQDYERSKESFSKAFEKELTNELLYTEWGNAMLTLFKIGDAREAFNKALQENKESKDAYIGLCMCDNVEGVDIRDIELSDNIFSYEAKGFYLFRQGEYSSAVDIFKQALVKEPKEVFNYYFLAKCYEKLNNFTMVTDSYSKLNKFNPNFEQGYVDFAKYLIKNKDLKEAQRKLRKAKTLNPENQETLNLLFYVGALLVKENICEYNIREVLSLVDEIENLEYPDLKEDLEGILKDLKK